ncbi:MAG TPA: uroporphyrinogen-III synthase [Xanthobacteraceae bacterium]|nr:uroporphyrinogen-III synthase [Xanthobacteraceae bacterium]
MRLLLTRPEPEAERTALTLRARGHAVLVAPLLQIEPIAVALDEHPCAALLMTSGSAARMLSVHPDLPGLLSRPVFVVGAHTAAMATNAGFADVTSADGDVSDLARLVARRFAGSSAKLLYLRGRETAGDLAGALARDGLDVDSIAIYQANAVQQFPAQAEEALRHGSIDGVLHFSRRTAQAYLACADARSGRQWALRPVHYCLSAQVAALLVDAGAALIRRAARPDEAALIRLIDA